MDRTTREDWAKRVERWKDSGLSAKEFAAEVGISARSLTWWKWRLGSPVAVTAKRARTKRARGARAPKVSPLTFVEMTAVSSEPIEIALPSRICVRVRAGFDDATLKRVLDALERRH
jgi:transposase